MHELEAERQEEMRIIIQVSHGIQKIDYKKAVSTACQKEAKKIKKLNSYLFRQCIDEYRLGKTL